MAKIYTLLNNNLDNIQKIIKNQENIAYGFHLDIIESKNNYDKSIWPDLITQIKNITQKPLQVHLLVQQPEEYINELNLNSIDTVIIDLASKSKLSLNQLINLIISKNKKVGIAINQDTPLESIIHIVMPINSVLINSSENNNEKNINLLIHKINALNNYKIAHKIPLDIIVKGNLIKDNIEKLIKVGTNEIIFVK